MVAKWVINKIRENTAVILSLAALVTSVVSAGVSYRQWQLAGKAIILVNRAWVVPKHARYLVGLEKTDAQPVVTIDLINSGPTPALDLSVNLIPLAIPIDLPTSVRDYPQSIFWNIADKQAETCMQKPLRTGTKPLYRVDGLSEQPRSEIIGQWNRQNLVSGAEAVVVLGCINYVSMQQQHHLAFCYYIPPQANSLSTDWDPIDCPSGYAMN